ncbi:hypothetical protein [Prevotella sp. ne3005]|nr:hypothetical protein [Prevotella sp. ne3005]
MAKLLKVLKKICLGLKKKSKSEQQEIPFFQRNRTLEEIKADLRRFAH